MATHSVVIENTNMRLSLTLAAVLAVCATSSARAGEDKKQSVPEQAGSIGGSIAGTTVGTTLGGPVGGAVGSMLGGTVGGVAGKVVHKVVHRKSKKPIVQSDEPAAPVVVAAATSEPSPETPAATHAEATANPTAEPAPLAAPELSRHLPPLRLRTSGSGFRRIGRRRCRPARAGWR